MLKTKVCRTLVREYEERDKEQAERCLVELQNYERSLEPDRLEGTPFVSRYLRYILKQCAKREGKAFVLEVDGSIAGFMSLFLEEAMEVEISSLKRCVCISDLVILPWRRGFGLGQVMLKEAQRYAERIGAQAIKVEALGKNTPAREFYEKNGYETYEIRFLKRF